VALEPFETQPIREWRKKEERGKKPVGTSLPACQPGLEAMPLPVTHGALKKRKKKKRKERKKSDHVALHR